MKSRGQLFSLATVLLVLALAPDAASASFAPFDRGFGDRGTLNVRNYAAPGRTVLRCDLTRRGRLAIAGRFDPVTTLRSRWGRYNRFATTSVDLSSKRGGLRAKWRRQPAPTIAPFEVDVYSDGSYVSATAVAQSRAEADFLLRRSHADGTRDNRFGRRGARRLRISTPGLASSYTSATIRALNDGGVIVAYATTNGLYLARINRRGAAETRWGDRGTVVIPRGARSSALPPTMHIPLDETRDGGVIVANDTDKGIAVSRLRANGSIDRGFGIDGSWYPPDRTEPARYGQALGPLVGAVSAHASGEIAVLYAHPIESELGINSSIRAAVVTGTGATKATSPELLTYYNGGDTGFPDAYPLAFELTKAGVVVGFAETYYPTATVRGVAVRWASEPNLIAAQHQIGLHGRDGMGIGDFAVARDGMSILACGSVGSVRSGRPKTQRAKRVVVRSIAL